MKLTPALTLLLLPAAALAQTATPATHHATTATHHPAAATTSAACPDMPTLGAAIPKEPGCPKTLFALKYIDLKIGDGPLAQTLKLYTVHYTGYLPDGTKFDSSVDRKDPIVFPAGVHRVITGWDTGFEGMHVGGKRRLFIPYELAYGEAGKPPTIPAKSMLIFDVELIAQADFPQQPPPAAPAAAPQGAPPAGASRPLPAATTTAPPPPAPAAAKPSTPPATTPKP